MKPATNFVVVAICFVSYKKQLEPTAVFLNKDFLVVEGFINTGHDSTIVKLSRMVNIRGVYNPAEPVIGYITAGTATAKRIFIDRNNLPAWAPVTFYREYGCAPNTVTVKSTDGYPYLYGGTHPSFLPTSAPNLAVPGICVDCTLRGTNKQPAFWK